MLQEFEATEIEIIPFENGDIICQMSINPFEFVSSDSMDDPNAKP